MNPAPTLATLAADPERLADLRPEDVPPLLGALAELEARLRLRLQAGAAPAVAAPASNGGPDRLLKAKEAAERLGVSSRWLYRNAERLPFSRRLSAGSLRFSERGLARWQESRR